MKDSNWVKPTNESSTIDQIRWTGDNVCKVKFLNGGVYAYENVSRAQFEEFRDAESAGRWHHTYLKSRAEHHPCTKLS